MSLFDEVTTSVAIYRPSQSSFGRSASVSLASTVTGFIQTMSVSESKDYDSEGEKLMHRVFFAANPAILKGDWLAVSLNDSILYRGRVLATEDEANPDRSLQVWNVVCEDISAVSFPVIA